MQMVVHVHALHNVNALDHISHRAISSTFLHQSPNNLLLHATQPLLYCHISYSFPTSRPYPQPFVHRKRATYYSKRTKNMPSRYMSVMREILGGQQARGIPQGRSTYAWSRVGEKDGKEGSEAEESNTPVIATAVLTVVTVIVVGRWLWIRNVSG